MRQTLLVESPKPYAHKVHRIPPPNPRLLELIRARNERHWQPSDEERKLGFRGWHQRGFLPHFDAPGVTQFVTFQLHDSFPVHRRREWEQLFHEPEGSARRKQLEAWLDRGHGECVLRQQDAARLVEKSLLETDGHACRLKAWVIMPNHVHLVVEVWNTPLAKLVSGWKGRSARRVNQWLGRQGRFWQEDYHDTLIRDEPHLKRTIRYTEQNPVKALMSRHARDWPWSSARHRDEYERLPWQRVAQERGIEGATA